MQVSKWSQTNLLPPMSKEIAYNLSQALRLFWFINFPAVVWGLVRHRWWFFFGSYSNAFLREVQSKKEAIDLLPSPAWWILASLLFWGPFPSLSHMQTGLMGSWPCHGPLLFTFPCYIGLREGNGREKGCYRCLKGNQEWDSQMWYKDTLVRVICQG